MSNFIRATFFKEMRILKNKIRTFIFSTAIFFVFITGMTLFMNRDQRFNIANGIVYIQLYMSIVGFLFSMNFWSEKVTGTLEYTLSNGIRLRSFVICKIAFNLIVGLCTSLCSWIILMTLFRHADYTGALTALFVYMAIAFPYGIINGIAMTCYRKGIASIFQYISLAMIFSSIVSVKFIANNLNNAYFIYTTVVIVIALWVISAVMLFSSNEEKAILAEIE